MCESWVSGARYIWTPRWVLKFPRAELNKVFPGSEIGTIFVSSTPTGPQPRTEKGTGEGVVQFRCKSLKSLISEREMKEFHAFTGPVPRAWARPKSVSKIQCLGEGRGFARFLADHAKGPIAVQPDRTVLYCAAPSSGASQTVRQRRIGPSSSIGSSVSIIRTRSKR